MYKTKISTEINSNDWNSELKKSNYSTYLQTAEYLNINSNENTFPIFISVLDEKNAVVGQLGLLIIKTSVQYGSALFQKLSKTISGVSIRGIWQYGPTIHTENKMEKKEIGTMVFTQYKDRFQLFIGFALLLLLADLILLNRKNKWSNRINFYKE